MAKDDYDVVVYRVLVYLYAVLKHKIIFEEATFRQAVRKNVESAFTRGGKQDRIKRGDS